MANPGHEAVRALQDRAPRIACSSSGWATFSELFGPDAEVAHQALGITLTERSKGMPMAGVPFHSIESYLRRLVDQGHRVAVCDQVQDPKEAKGVVDRAVTRVLTPGTLVDEALLDAGEQNIIAAVAPAKRGARVVMGIATIELSTGESTVQEISPEELPDALARIDPAELLLPDDDAIQDLDILAGTELASRLGAALTRRSGWIFRMADAQDLLHQHYGVNSPGRLRTRTAGPGHPRRRRIAPLPHGNPVSGRRILNHATRTPATTSTAAQRTLHDPGSGNPAQP